MGEEKEAENKDRENERGLTILPAFPFFVLLRLLLLLLLWLLCHRVQKAADTWARPAQDRYKPNVVCEHC